MPFLLRLLHTSHFAVWAATSEKWTPTRRLWARWFAAASRLILWRLICLFGGTRFLGIGRGALGEIFSGVDDTCVLGDRVSRRAVCAELRVDCVGVGDV
jgi:hypothetical protein